MTELLGVVLRAIGVVLPGAALWGFVELTRGVPAGDFETFLGAVFISLLTAGLWAAIDASRARASRVLIRWIAVAFVVAGGLGVGGTLTYPGTPPGPERTSEAIWSSLYYGVPLLVAVGLGVAVGMAAAAENEQSTRRYDDTVGRGTGH